MEASRRAEGQQVSENQIRRLDAYACAIERLDEHERLAIEQWFLHKNGRGVRVQKLKTHRWRSLCPVHCIRVLGLLKQLSSHFLLWTHAENRGLFASGPAKERLTSSFIVPTMQSLTFRSPAEKTPDGMA